MTLQLLAEDVHAHSELLPFVGLNQLPIDKDTILLRAEACQKKLSLLLDDHGVLLCDTDRKFVAFGEAE